MTFTSMRPPQATQVQSPAHPNFVPPALAHQPEANAHNLFKLNQSTQQRPLESELIYPVLEYIKCFYIATHREHITVYGPTCLVSTMLLVDRLKTCWVTSHAKR